MISPRCLNTIVLPLLVVGCAAAISSDDVALGRNAAVSLAANLQAASLVRQGRLEEAAASLDTSLYRDLSYLIIVYPTASSDPAFVRETHRTVRALKALWLRNPPSELDAPAIDFIEMICMKSGDCPSGVLKSAK